MDILSPPDMAFAMPHQHQLRGNPEAHASTGPPSKVSERGRRSSYDTAYRPSPTDTDYEQSHAWPPRKVTHQLQNHFMEGVGIEQQVGGGGDGGGDDGYGYGHSGEELIAERGGGGRRVSFLKPGVAGGGGGVIEGVGLGTVHAVGDRRGSVQFLGMGKDEGQVGKERQAEKEKEEKKEELKKEVLETVKKEREKEREEREKEEEERIEWEKREVGVQVPEEEGGDGDSGGDQKRRSRKEKADEEGIEVSIPTVAVTQIRKPYVRKGKGGKLMNLGTPRVNTAPSVENPHGTTKSQYTTHHKFQTVLQQHVSFFDADNDYIIWPSDTYNGFRRLGFNPIICLFAAIVVHAVLSYPTTPSGSEGKSLLTKIILFPFSILPDPFFRIWVDRIHKSKLEVGTGVFDTEGRFVPQHFEDIFEKYSSVPPNHPALGPKGTLGSVGGDGGVSDDSLSPQEVESDTSPSTNTKQGLTLHDIFIICLTNLNIFNPVGSFMEVMHWGLVYLLLWPQDGIMRKEDIRRVYDGSLFWDVAEKKEGGGNLLGRNRVASPVNEPTGFLRGDKLGEITGMK